MDLFNHSGQANLWDRFEKKKDEGLQAYESGSYEIAQRSLSEAAHWMAELVIRAPTAELAQEREEVASALVELAGKCPDLIKGRATVKAAPSGAPHVDKPSQNTSENSSGIQPIKISDNVRYKDVIGLEDAKEALYLAMTLPFERPDLCDKFKLKSGGIILLYGPPGTGKTQLAKAAANELDADFFSLTPTDINTKWLGESEAKVRELFTKASQCSRAVVFIDEADMLIPKRTEDSKSWERAILSEFLQATDGVKGKKGNVLLILGTNRPWDIDSAFLSRASNRVYVPLPDAKAREQLLKLHLSSSAVSSEVDFAGVTEPLELWSGRDINQLAEHVNARAALIESREKRPVEITNELIRDVAKGIVPRTKPEDVRRLEEWRDKAK